MRSPLRLDAAAVQRAEHLERGHQIPGVVADAGRAQDVALALDAQVGVLGEDGVRVRGEDDRRPAAGALAHAAHVRDVVGLDVAEPELLHLGPDVGRARLLLSRRRRHFRQLDPLVHDARGLGRRPTAAPSARPAARAATVETSRSAPQPGVAASRQTMTADFSIRTAYSDRSHTRATAEIAKIAETLESDDQISAVSAGSAVASYRVSVQTKVSAATAPAACSQSSAFSCRNSSPSVMNAAAASRKRQ